MLDGFSAPRRRGFSPRAGGYCRRHRRLLPVFRREGGRARPRIQQPRPRGRGPARARCQRAGPALAPRCQGGLMQPPCPGPGRWVGCCGRRPAATARVPARCQAPLARWRRRPTMPAIPRPPPPFGILQQTGKLLEPRRPATEAGQTAGGAGGPQVPACLLCPWGMGDRAQPHSH